MCIYSVGRVGAWVAVRYPRAVLLVGVVFRGDVPINTLPVRGEDDKRIKVAIIDNGVDRIRASIRNMIDKGISFVAGGSQSADQNEILPWWMVSDPHGTQMASLIGQTNPYCRLYIARVGKGRGDILTKHAIEVRSQSQTFKFPGCGRPLTSSCTRLSNGPSTTRP